ncbi:hypothetical protein BYT27DRAFT_7216243 [Phlegmacium glaucopus]|nr:hypothetical protein BYT27DRAFT_7216243 [Phlegmacium glaucopus]
MSMQIPFPATANNDPGLAQPEASTSCKCKQAFSLQDPNNAELQCLALQAERKKVQMNTENHLIKKKNITHEPKPKPKPKPKGCNTAVEDLNEASPAQKKKKKPPTMIPFSNPNLIQKATKQPLKTLKMHIIESDEDSDDEDDIVIRDSDDVPPPLEDDDEEEGEEEEEVEEKPKETAEAELAHLQRGWNATIYAFFKPNPTIKYFNG